MVVQHNMQAANANRMLSVTTGQQAKSTEKLSSGYRINRAADDAAGLTISEKMRKQIRGLDQASTNAQDGVSSVQTAEGALTEVHSMLQRMNELATQASNGTNSESDRSAIQDEISQLTTEIDRVSETTKFNETYLLKGDENGGTTQNTINAHDAGLAGKLTGVGTGAAKFTANKLSAGSKVTIAGQEYTIDDTTVGGKVESFSLKDGNAATDFGVVGKTNATTSFSVADWAAGGSIQVNGKTAIAQTSAATANDLLVKINEQLAADGEFEATLDNNTITITAKEAGTKTALAVTGNVKTGSAVAATTTDGDDAGYVAFKDEDEMKAALAAGKEIKKTDKNTAAVADTDYAALIGGNNGKITTANAYKLMARELETASNIGTDSDKKATVTNNNDGTFDITEGKAETSAKLSFSLHVGADADMTNKINVDIESMSAAGLGIKGLNVKDTTGMSATYAIDAIADAISKVSEQRSALGAVQNRLEHTISNVDNVVENTTSAESRIRDTDMAKEMVNYSKNNILAQAGQSMLAQANQSNQGVLSLLQ